MKIINNLLCSVILSFGSVVVVDAQTPTPTHTKCNNSAIPVTGDMDLGAHYELDTGTNHCFEITSDNVDFDMKGYTIHCSRAGGCPAAAIKVSADNATIIDGTIEGDWTSGITNHHTSFVASDLDVIDVIFDGTKTGLTYPGSLTKNNVFKNMQSFCTSTFLVKMPENGKIQQNYCWSEEDGLLFTGPSSGTSAKVERNFVSAADIGIDAAGGIVDLTHNIVSEATTPMNIRAGTTDTLTENICEDDTECPFPDATSFTLSVDW